MKKLKFDKVLKRVKNVLLMKRKKRSFFEENLSSKLIFSSFSVITLFRESSDETIICLLQHYFSLLTFETESLIFKGTYNIGCTVVVALLTCKKLVLTALITTGIHRSLASDQQNIGYSKNSYR